MQNPDTLRAAFRSNLEEQTQRNGWQPNERAVWILDHLDEYIERWLGFADMSINPRALIRSDLFTVMEIAVEALEQETALLYGSSGHHVEKIREALEALRTHGNVDYARNLNELAVELKSRLTAR